MFPQRKPPVFVRLLVYSLAIGVSVLAVVLPSRWVTVGLLKDALRNDKITLLRTERTILEEEKRRLEAAIEATAAGGTETDDVRDGGRDW